MTSYNEINGPVYGQAFQAENLYLQNAQEHVSSIALYYPYIHVRDDTWLKYAALYWPKVTRLVPRNYRPHDSLVSWACVRAGVLRDLTPRQAPSGGRQFFAMIGSRGRELRDRYGVVHRDQWPVRNKVSSAGIDTDPRLTYLHCDKLEDSLVDQIVSSDLGVHHRGRGGRWIGMHPDLANVYMCLLVNDLAHHESLHPVTDQDLPHDALFVQNVDRITEVLLGVPPRPQHRDVTQQFVTAAVHTVVPEGLADVPVEKILELRETFPKDFHRFRAHVGDRFTELRAEATTDLHIGVAVDELVRSELAELEDKLRSIKLIPRRVRVWLKADAVRESPVGWLFQVGQALR